MGLVEVMSAVHLALKARLLPRRVVRAKLWGDHPQHWGGTIREDKRLEYRPSRVIGLDRERKRRLRNSHQPKEDTEGRKLKIRRERKHFSHFHIRGAHKVLSLKI